MNTHASPKTCQSLQERGITLLECIVYISVVGVVLGIGTQAFYRCWDYQKILRRNSEDIVRALHAGEQWRADIRSATGTIERLNEDGGECLHIPVPGKTIVYTFSDGELRRQAGPGLPEVVVLPNVRSSQMQLESRRQVTSWRWELELQPSQKKARLHPLFTFEAVAGGRIAR